MILAAAASVALLAALGAASPPSPVLTPLEASALDRVRAALPQRTVPALSAELVQAARALAQSAAGGEPRPLSSPAMRAALGEAGVVDPAPAAVVLSARVASLPEAIASAARFRGATHLGIGVVIRDELAWAVLLASERRAELDPFPRQVAPGGIAVLSGRLLQLDGPRAWVSDPSGAAVEVPVEADGRRFRTSIRFAPARDLAPRGGWVWAARVDGGGARRGDVRRWRSARVPGRRPRAAPGPPPRPASEPPRTCCGLARGSARSRGRPRSTSRPGATARPCSPPARWPHRLDGGGALAERLASSGVRFRSARENVARGDGAVDAHRAMVESPAHLANLLEPRVELMGLGIARGALPGGQPVVYLTEILVEPRDPVPAGDPPTGQR